MLVQHFFPPTPTANGDGGGGSSSSSSIRRSSSYSSSSPPSSSVLTNTKKTSKPFSSFFHSESTGFQPTMEESIRMNYNEKIQTHLSAWPRKLTSVMDIHRQGFSQLNPRFKQQQQQQRTTNKSVQQPPVCPVVLPSASRPQPRQQARLKPSPETLPPQQPIRRSTTAHTKPQSIPSEPNNQYLTLANLTKILHVLQTQDQINDHETSTDTSTSTTNSAKQRVQQHLQETATRWWKASRSSDCQSTAPATSTTQPYLKSATPAQVPSPNTPSRTPKQSDNLPLLVKIKSFQFFLFSFFLLDNCFQLYSKFKSSSKQCLCNIEIRRI